MEASYTALQWLMLMADVRDLFIALSFHLRPQHSAYDVRRLAMNVHL